MIFLDLLQFALLQFDQLGKMIYFFCIGWIYIIENVIAVIIGVFAGIIIDRRINRRNILRSCWMGIILTAHKMKNTQACQYKNSRSSAPTQEVHANNNSSL